MEKLIIVAGSPNTGKTITTNLVICKLLERGYTPAVHSIDDDKFLKRLSSGEKDKLKIGGVVILEKNGKKIVVISFGDIVADIDEVIKEIDFSDIYCLVCCSHATRGKKVFDYFHNFIKKVYIDNVDILPIYKNLICGHGRDYKENEQLSRIIVEWID